MGDGHTPFQVARDGPVTQALIEPFIGDRLGQARPFGRGIDPVADPALHLGLDQMEMLGLTHFEILRAGDFRIRLFQIGRLEQAAAIIALIAPRALETTMRAGSLDIAVRQETVIIDREDLLLDPLDDQPLVLQHLGEMLGQADSGGTRGAAEIIIAQRETVTGALLDIMLLVAIGAHIHARRIGGQFGRRTVLVRRADIKDIMTAQALETGIDIGRQHGPGQISQMLDAIDVRQSAGDQYTGHGRNSSLARKTEYSVRVKGESWGHRLAGRDIQALHGGGNRKCREFSD